MGKILRFAGHPVHPMLVHFPMALCPVSVLWDLIGCLQPGEALWWRLSFVTLAAGLAAAVPAAVTGFVDFASLDGEEPASPVAVRHLVAMGSGVSLFLASLLTRQGWAPPEETRLWIALSLSVAGAAAFAAGGRFGGDLVYRYGLGRVPNSITARRENARGQP